MGLQSAGGHLEKATRQLTSAWALARESWKDVKMAEFEERFITVFQQDARLTIETLTRMNALFAQVRRDCSGSETM